MIDKESNLNNKFWEFLDFVFLSKKEGKAESVISNGLVTGYDFYEIYSSSNNKTSKSIHLDYLSITECKLIGQILKELEISCCCELHYSSKGVYSIVIKKLSLNTHRLRSIINSLERMNFISRASL